MQPNKIVGKVYVVGDNIDTDQIIPAKHLVYDTHSPEERKLFGKYAMSGVPEEKSGLPRGGIKFVEDGTHLSIFNIIVGGKNFGCGSSREHAPLALQVAGVKAVVAQTYARIFYRNSVDGGFIMPLESVENIFAHFKTGDEIAIDLEKNIITDSTSGKSFALRALGDAAEIINSGGLFSYARKIGMIRA
ncbi:MAG TPA: 3-isopropylmalate dehydratase [Candidatus Acidoferrales bacterium]|nr:3-isopropylmalate dehydratase [Candidatus Acidoferrales bacterium]